MTTMTLDSTTNQIFENAHLNPATSKIAPSQRRPVQTYLENLELLKRDIVHYKVMGEYSDASRWVDGLVQADKVQTAINCVYRRQDLEDRKSRPAIMDAHEPTWGFEITTSGKILLAAMAIAALGYALSPAKGATPVPQNYSQSTTYHK